MKTKLAFLNALIALLCLKAIAQTDTSKVIPVKGLASMSVMVVPRIESNITLKNVSDTNKIAQTLNGSKLQRYAIGLIQEVFDQRGFKTIDFEAKLEEYLKTSVINENGSMGDVLIDLAAAEKTDIVVTLDVQFNSGTMGGSIINVPMKAIDATSNTLIAVLVQQCESKSSTTKDTVLLLKSAITTNCMDNFLNAIVEGYKDMVTNGRPLQIFVLSDPSSKYNLNSIIPANGKKVSALIEDWLDENTVNENYNIAGSSNSQLILNSVHMPFFNSKNLPFKPTRWAEGLVEFLNSKGLQTHIESRRGTMNLIIK